MVLKRNFERAWREVLTSLREKEYWPLDEAQLKDIGAFLDNLDLLIVDCLLAPAWHGEVSVAMSYSNWMESGSEHAVSTRAAEFWYTTWIAREVLFHHRQPSFTQKTLPVPSPMLYLPPNEPKAEAHNPFYGLDKKRFPELAKAWKTILGEIPVSAWSWEEDDPEEKLIAGGLYNKLLRVYTYPLSPGDIALNLTFKRNEYGELHALFNALEWFCTAKMMKRNLWGKKGK